MHIQAFLKLPQTEYKNQLKGEIGLMHSTFWLLIHFKRADLNF